MSLETIREFLGWCTVLNFAFMAIGIIKLMAIREWASNVHAKMFNVDDAWIRQAYFQFFCVYKIGIVVFNLVPYIALRMMAGS